MRRATTTALFDYEHRSQPVLPQKEFLRRLAKTSFVGSVIVIVSLAVGMAGYHWLEHMAWLDAFVNAAMILSGMGPLAAPQTTVGKIFEGVYALYSGLAVLVIAGITFAPLIHRFLHRLHAENDEATTPQ
jgi:hypothetical protein